MQHTSRMYADDVKSNLEYSRLQECSPQPAFTVNINMITGRHDVRHHDAIFRNDA